MNGPTPHQHAVELEEAFDFLNTKELESGALVDHLATPDDAFDWLATHDLVHRELLDREREKLADDAEAGTRALARIRRVRDALRELAEAIVESRVAAPSAIAEVNRALRAPGTIELEATS